MWTQQVRVITQQNYNRLVAALWVTDRSFGTDSWWTCLIVKQVGLFVVPSELHVTCW
jgi:hypothetical protein